MKILVSAAGTVLGQAIIKSLKAADLDVNIIALNADPYGAGLYWANSYYIVPRADDPMYLNRVRAILAKEQPALVLLALEPEYSVFSDVKEEIEKEYSTKILVSSPLVLKIAGDKWLTYKFLKDNDLDHPKSCLPGDEEKLLSDVGFPLIVKPRSGAESVGVRIVNSLSELQDAIGTIEQPIIQESVGSAAEEYTAGVVVLEGKAKSSITMKRELKYGNTSVAKAESYSPINKYLEKVAECLGVYGPVNLQYRLVDNKVKIFEINARFSGTTYFRTLSNVNELELIIRELILNERVQQPVIKPAQIIRYYDEMIIPEA